MSKTRPVWPASTAQAADWPRLAAAWGSLGCGLTLGEATGAPASRRLSMLAFDTGRAEAGARRPARTGARREHKGPQGGAPPGHGARHHSLVQAGGERGRPRSAGRGLWRRRRAVGELDAERRAAWSQPRHCRRQHSAAGSVHAHHAHCLRRPRACALRRFGPEMQGYSPPWPPQLGPGSPSCGGTDSGLAETPLRFDHPGHAPARQHGLIKCRPLGSAQPRRLLNVSLGRTWKL